MKLLECRNAPYGANNFPFLSLRLPGSPCLALWMKGRATKMVKFSFISIYSEGPIYLSLSTQSNKRKDSKNIFIHFPFSIENRLLMKWDEMEKLFFFRTSKKNLRIQFITVVSLLPLAIGVLRMRSVCANENYEMKRKIPRGEVNGRNLPCDDEKIFTQKI